MAHSPVSVPKNIKRGYEDQRQHVSAPPLNQVFITARRPQDLSRRHSRTCVVTAAGPLLREVRPVPQHDVQVHPLERLRVEVQIDDDLRDPEPAGIRWPRPLSLLDIRLAQNLGEVFAPLERENQLLSIDLLNLSVKIH